jgi:tetratricopeptide (TPR) repeat protein
MGAESRCRGCGGALPSSALGGLCPVCLLRQGLDGDNSAPGNTGFHANLTQAPVTAGVPSVLAESCGTVPQTLLRDTDPGPLVLPGSPEMPAAGERTGRLQLLGEIARGGMGAVLKGRDNDIGRDLAVKVLLDSHRDKPDLIRRFIEEAQIGGQLQHPGIVPIYELGALADSRPYFAMKLVKGRTLSSLLDARPDPAHDLPRYLSIFEALCQTMAYAHARGVIHRDLKPSNIMVGSFGEVQVMDWGLAKVLPQGGAIDDAAAGKTRDRDTVIATARSGSDTDSDLSRAGSVMGTPSYMAPEQARGEVDLLDERCDVFALGSILCEILTGEPAFTGRSSGEIQRRASRGELKDALDRLVACGADAELIALARDCLASELADRPRHADAIAERIIAHRTGVQERLRHAEIARAEEKARALEATKRARVERDRLRLTVALAAAVLGLILLGGGGWAYLAQLRATRRAATERVVTQALEEANLLRGQAKAAAVGDLVKWSEAHAVAKQALSLLLAGEPSAALHARVNTLLADLQREQADAANRAAQASRDRRFLERLEAVRLDHFGEPDKWFPKARDASYATAFREFGIDIDRLDPTEAGRRVRARSNPLELAFFLDDWALVRREALNAGGEAPKDRDPWRHLIAAARAADPDPWRNKLRGLIGSKDSEAVKRLAHDEDALGAQPARSLQLLAQVLEAHDDKAQAEKLLKRAWRLRPDDFWSCSQLARNSAKERVRFATAAVALRPGSAPGHLALAEALAASNEPVPFSLALGGLRGVATYTDDPASWAEAETYPQRPFSSPGPVALDSFIFSSYKKLGEPYCELICLAAYKFKLNDEIIEECREAVRLNPMDAATRRGFARVLMHTEGKLDEAIEQYRQAMRLQPVDVFKGDDFGYHLALNGRSEEAIRVLGEVRRASSQYRSFIAPLPLFLGTLLRKEGKIQAAVSEFRQELLAGENPDFVAGFLRTTAKPEEAISIFRERMRLHPQEISTIAHLGDVFRSQGRLDEESALYREAIRLDPKAAKLHGLLAHVLERQRKRDEAKAEFANEIGLHRDAIQRNSKDALARQSLAGALFDQGMWDEALKELREAFRIAPSSEPYNRFAMDFYSHGNVYQAITLSREAVRLNPTDHAAHYNLGYYLLDSGEADTAVAEFREALRIQPNNPAYLDSLASAQFATGELKAALGNLQQAALVMKEFCPPYLLAHLRRIERLSSLEPRLGTILGGQDVPADAPGKLDVAELCRVTRRSGAAARLYREAFQARPALADDLSSQQRLHAALAAACAGTKLRPAKDDPALDDTARARWRAQALEWLRAERDSCAKLLTQGLPAQRAHACKTLDILRHHRDLAPLRDEAGLKQLPDDERKAWPTFWAEVNALLAKAQ